MATLPFRSGRRQGLGGVGVRRHQARLSGAGHSAPCVVRFQVGDDVAQQHRLALSWIAEMIALKARRPSLAR